MPPRIFIRVDLPAPFSPASATTSPALIWKSTPLSACTPPKRFSIPRICSTALFICFLCVFSVSSVSLWFLPPAKVSTTETQRTQRFFSASAPQLVDLLREVVDGIALNNQRRHENLFAGRNRRAIPFKHLVHQLHRLITEFKWLLDHRGIDRPVANAFECRVLLVKGHDLHLAYLICIAHGTNDRRTVVTPKTHERFYVSVLDQRVGD